MINLTERKGSFIRVLCSNIFRPLKEDKMLVSSEEVAKLRSVTGAGMMQCKEALTVANGDQQKAADWLRLQGVSQLADRASKAANEGWVYAYSHNGKIGVLVEVNCETDFVARSAAFQEFVKDLSLHIAAAYPRCVSRDQVPEELAQREREFCQTKIEKRTPNKPEAIKKKILDGMMDKWYKEVCLLEQTFVKNDKLTIEQLLLELVSKVKEKVVIKQFSRIQLGLST